MEAEADLSAFVEALCEHGIDRCDAGRMVADALELGAEWYALELARDPRTWARFRAGFDALRAGGEVPYDAVIVGALVWAYLDGAAFMARVTRCALTPPAVH